VAGVVTTDRRGTATWEGDLETGQGQVRTESGMLEAAYEAASRFEDGDETTPEELIGAAHAACYSMALASVLEAEGYEPDDVNTEARIELAVGDSPHLTKVHLAIRGRADEIDEETFRELAEHAEHECLVSGVFGGLPVEIEASLATPTPG
jgi:osmotically inducible protein OsmC